MAARRVSIRGRIVIFSCFRLPYRRLCLPNAICDVTAATSCATISPYPSPVRLRSTTDISFIVWDTVDSRRDPAASFQVKVKKHFCYWHNSVKIANTVTGSTARCTTFSILETGGSRSAVQMRTVRMMETGGACENIILVDDAALTQCETLLRANNLPEYPERRKKLAVAAFFFHALPCLSPCCICIIHTPARSVLLRFAFALSPARGLHVPGCGGMHASARRLPSHQHDPVLGVQPIFCAQPIRECQENTHTTTQRENNRTKLLGGACVLFGRRLEGSLRVFRPSPLIVSPIPGGFVSLCLQNSIQRLRSEVP